MLRRRRRNMPCRRMIFYHIPKSAGTSIKDTMLNLKLNRAILDSYSYSDNEKCCFNFYVDSPTEPINYIHIHEWNPSNMFTTFNPSSGDFKFTILRDPISTFYSVYYHNFDETHDLEFKVSAIEFNHQALHRSIISSCKHINHYIDVVLSLGQLTKTKIPPYGYYNDQFLSSLDFVGIFEDLPGTMGYLSQQLNIDLSQLTKSNAKEYNRDMSYRIDELNQYFAEEIAVYNKYKAKFCQLMLSS